MRWQQLASPSRTQTLWQSLAGFYNSKTKMRTEDDGEVQVVGSLNVFLALNLPFPVLGREKRREEKRRDKKGKNQNLRMSLTKVLQTRPDNPSNQPPTIRVAVVCIQDTLKVVTWDFDSYDNISDIKRTVLGNAAQPMPMRTVLLQEPHSLPWFLKQRIYRKEQGAPVLALTLEAKVYTIFA
ncbi:hypothetical protein D9C73_016923 [Collichthys lucidus]|uniref:Uncharacterized protein n=1 Tax=Collichthys lucidus TaxID=240159 RepID=A0A4U5V4N2_COLLU|nr:hypothetical protein D9C73_016923 [Collichthys lucidus]